MVDSFGDADSLFQGPGFDAEVGDVNYEWITFTGLNGLTLRTSSFEGYAAGSRFVAVDDRAGKPVGVWLSESWGEEGRAEDVMRTIWFTAADGETIWDDEYDVELTFNVAGGAVRCCAEGSYVRLVDGDRMPLLDGSAYWVADEWVDDPELVMGAICGLLTTIS